MQTARLLRISAQKDAQVEPDMDKVLTRPLQRAVKRR